MDIIEWIAKYVGIPAAVIAAILVCAWLLNLYTSLFMKKEEYERREAASEKIHDGISETVQSNTAMLVGQINRVAKETSDNFRAMDETLTTHHTNLYGLVEKQKEILTTMNSDVAVLKEKIDKVEKRIAI